MGWSGPWGSKGSVKKSLRSTQYRCAPELPLEIPSPVALGVTQPPRFQSKSELPSRRPGHLPEPRTRAFNNEWTRINTHENRGFFNVGHRGDPRHDGRDAERGCGLGMIRVYSCSWVVGELPLKLRAVLGCQVELVLMAPPRRRCASNEFENLHR